MSNWYVVQMSDGYEEKIVSQYRSIEECFMPKYKKEGNCNKKDDFFKAIYV